MDDLSPEDRDKLDHLIKQRDAHQISEYSFEDSKRKLLGEPPLKVPVVKNALIIAAIFAVILGASAVLYPENTSIFFSSLFESDGSYRDRSILGTIENVREVKESFDEVADQLFADPASWSRSPG